MLTSIKQRLGHDDEQGFTLIELMVVVLIIAILLAIAIPTFLGARNSANSRAAQSSLRNALTAEQTYYANNQTFGTFGSTPTIMTIEPNLTWTATALTATSGPNTIFAATVTLAAVDTSQVFLQSWAKDGNCYTIFQNNDAAVTIAGGNTGYNTTHGACAASTNAPATITAGSSSANPGAVYYNTW